MLGFEMGGMLMDTNMVLRREFQGKCDESASCVEALLAWHPC